MNFKGWGMAQVVEDLPDSIRSCIQIPVLRKNIFLYVCILFSRQLAPSSASLKEAFLWGSV
jgi:hypothetical protein